MLVKWNGLGCWAIGDPTNKTGKVIVCLPGVNTIPDNIWEIIAKNPAVQAKMKPNAEGKILVEVLAEKTPDAKAAEKAGEAVDLSGMKPAEAVTIVNQCLNKELLEQWMDQDARPKVQRAILKQLEHLKLQKNPDAKLAADAEE